MRITDRIDATNPTSYITFLTWSC